MLFIFFLSLLEPNWTISILATMGENVLNEMEVGVLSTVVCMVKELRRLFLILFENTTPVKVLKVPCDRELNKVTCITSPLR